nr:lipid transfer protein [Ipomoea trifida]
MVVISPHAEAAITCDKVMNSIRPCIWYIMMGGRGRVPRDCCRGVESLHRLAKTTADRRAACQCLKSAAQHVPGGGNVIDRAAKIPAKCGVRLPFKISSSTNCYRIP